MANGRMSHCGRVEIAIVDVPTMTYLGTLETDGFVACGMIKLETRTGS